VRGIAGSLRIEPFEGRRVRLRWTRPVWQRVAMEFESVFQASDGACKTGGVQSGELNAPAEDQMPSSQPRECALRRWEVGKNHDRNTRMAQVPAHLLSSPQLEIC
jgi:hypothetical protein